MSNESSPDEILRLALESRKQGIPVRIDLPGAELSGRHLPAADLVGANLRGAELTGAILAGARLSRADLRGANLIGASLDGADLTDADLRGADLAGARIDDAVFTNARLEGACLTSVLGDPLSMVEAKMDRQTVILSEFTMRDIAEMVVRGAIVNEKETIPPSLTPPKGERGSPPRTAEAPKREEVVALSLLEAPQEAPGQPLLAYFPPSKFNARAGAFAPSFFPPSGQTSIVPTIREAEVSARLTIADQDGGEVPASRRMFQDLNALIDAARIEQTAGSLSLRPQLPAIEQMKRNSFQFPRIGDEYLGVKITEVMKPGVSSRCFRARGGEGETFVVRIFDPGCNGAALQLPAFQRGLRALNKLQGVNPGSIRVVELIAVAPDQTAYVMKDYTGGTLQDLVDGSLSLQDGLAAVQSLCESVGEIHQQGLMVRSWKPSNLFVDGKSIVIGELDMVHLTTMSQYRADLFGYRNYSAPEEIIGAGTRSPNADVFSLGKILEFILTREEPFIPLGGARVLDARDNIPKVLVDIVTRATAHDASERYQDARDLGHDLSVYKMEGDRAVLVASIRPQVTSQLSVRPLSHNPDLPKHEEVVRKHKERVRRPQKPAGISVRRQIELGVALLGGLGGLAVSVLLILSPTSVDTVEGMLPYVSGAVGLSVFGLRAPREKIALYRAWTWLGAAGLFYLLDPLQFAHLAWERRLSSGTIEQRQMAAQSLSRIGKADFTGVTLSGTNFSGKDLASAKFNNANLTGVNFGSAFLLETDFRQADISGANFVGANLQGAKLEGAIGLEEASCDRYTLLPLGVACTKGYLSATASGDSGSDSPERQSERSSQPRRAVPVVPQ
jgi:uncharacterized protein YjbI with pentapeptide repeats/serine/threonine protein kinase